MSILTEFSYIGFVYHQGKSAQTLLTFCAPADEIKQWGGVPAKTARFHGGFQRALGKRYKKIQKFFEAGDVSPTSIIVAFREDQLKVTPLGYPPGWPSEKGLTHAPKLAHISFEASEVDPVDADTLALAQQVAEAIGGRLGKGAVGLGESPDFGLSAEEEESETGGEDVSAEDAEESEDTLDIGVSKLKEFYDFVSSPEAVTAWIAVETAKFGGGTGGDDLSPELSLRTLLLSLLKPAMIVDGQHRVTGAASASVEKDVVFTVCALKDADWVEQVFQFVVLNKLARAISKDFLTGLLNTSLTNEEIKTIEPKLDRVGITNADRLMMRAVNFNVDSPFFDMVAPSGEVVGAVSAGKLSGQGMLKIARRWRAMGGATKKSSKELKMFERALPAPNHKARQRKWLEGAWVVYFHAFWRVVKSMYEREQIWTKGSGFNLLMIVTMHELQDFFLETKATADSRFGDVDDFKSNVRTFFDDVPAGFFQNWEATGLQSGDGPATIRAALKMFKDGSSLKDVKRDSPLFRDVKEKAPSGKSKTK